MSGAKLWLDGLRPAPEGWTWVKTAREAIECLSSVAFEVVSLDHDLGDDLQLGTGLDVLVWIEEQVICFGFTPPQLCVHSMNPVGRQKMLFAIQAIQRHTH